MENSISSQDRASGPIMSVPPAAASQLGISEELLPSRLHLGSQKQPNDAKRDSILVDRYALQAAAAKLMPTEAVAKCHFSIIGSMASLVYIPSSDSSAFGNFETCHSVWMCAVCSSRISFERQNELNQAIEAAHALGLQVAMCTYTFAHYKGDNLNGNLDAMLKARRSMVSGRAAKELKAKYGTVGCIRCIEVTHGMENGFHPHVHELIFFDVENEREYARQYVTLAREYGLERSVNALYERILNQAIAEKIEAYGKDVAARWMSVAAKQGLSMNGHGFQIDSTDAKIANYIAKFGKEPGEKTRRAWSSGEWNEASEMTQWHRKRGASEHYTPFDLLRFADEGDEEAAKLFQVYARAFKGRLQLYFPGVLRKRLGMPPKSKTDQEIIEEHELDKQEIAMITSKLFYEHIRQKKHARPKILNVVRRAKGNIAPVAEYMMTNFEAVLEESILEDGSRGSPIFRHINDCLLEWEQQYAHYYVSVAREFGQTSRLEVLYQQILYQAAIDKLSFWAEIDTQRGFS